jgi:hypothetical protein
MRSYILKFVLFILPLILLLIPLDMFLSKNLKKSRTYVSGEYVIWNDIYDAKMKDDVVIYGASRAMVNFDSKMLEDSLHRSCYDLGINGLGFWHIYLRHREFLRFNNPPKFIIFSIDICSLVRDKNLYNEDQFLPYMLGNENIFKYLKDVNDFTFFDYYIPLVRYFGKRNAINQSIKCSIANDNSKYFRSKGYAAMDFGWNDDFDNAQRKLGHLNINIDSASVKLFDEFLFECRSKNIGLILVYSPEYIDGQTFVKGRDKIMKIYSDFAEKYNILFLDYSKDEMSSQKKYFYNSTHLNKTGSDLFTDKLIKDLKKTNILHGIYLSDKK